MDIRTVSSAIADAVEQAGPGIVEVRGSRRPASGVAWTDHLVITVSHAVRADEIVVTTADGKEAAATLVGRDRATDLAVLEVGEGGLVPVRFGAVPRVGELVLPMARVRGRTRATLGLVSDVAGAWQTFRGGAVDAWIEVDASLPGGFSGGPLMSADGAVVGLNTATLTHRGAVLPASTVVEVAQRLRDHGTIEPGYLGVGFHPGTLPTEVAATVGQAEALMAVSIEPGGPGEQAGVQIGDALVQVDGQPVTGLRHLVGLLTAKGADAEVVLTMVRAGTPTAVTVNLGARPRRRRRC